MNKYLLMVDEIRMQALMAVLPALEFLEVQGMDITGNPTVKILASPVKVPMPTIVLEPEKPSADPVTPEIV